MVSSRTAALFQSSSWNRFAQPSLYLPEFPVEKVPMKKYVTLVAAAALSLPTGPVYAQTSTGQQTSQRDRIGTILGTLFGDRQGATTSIEAQWAAGQMPLANQRSQFESRVDTDVRSGALSPATGARLKSDYAALVQMEARYGADGRFTTQERTELADRYGALTQVLASGDAYGANAAVADGRGEFERRVDAAVSARRISRTQGTRLKTDYSAVVQVEASYLRDGTVSDGERDDLDSRLDALDVRLGDTTFRTTALTPRSRLDAIVRALPSSGLSSAAQAQLRVEHEDLSRLEVAYAQLNVSADNRAYLERRLTNLETRARIGR